MDIIFLRGLKIETVIGIFEWERRIRQTVLLDLDLATDIRNSASSDAIKDTLDYKALSKRVIQFVETSDCFLVETLAERIAAVVLSEFPTPWVRVTLNKKGAISGASDVGVIIERGQTRP